jgi:serine/threonine-protein kinase
MPLTAGDKLGPYEILAPIGAGGMGEVYRARDTKLERDVAIKVLPAALAQDPERLARFEREAKVLASLNHPNIAQIYGIEESSSGCALVMELVPGHTLQTPLPQAEARRIGVQIAEALEAAHEKGIIHRDLKPANVMITPSGVAKVLDFGLAAVTPDATSDSNSANSPTLTMMGTQAGFIIGTAAYMSPEQAAGKPVDKRSDIWSFGVVLWEMLTGKRLFDGETISHTLAHVLTAPIDFRCLPATTPPAIRELLARCLDRTVRNRMRDIGEARIALENAGQAPAEVAMPARPAGRLPWVAAAAAVIVAVSFGFLYWHAPRPGLHPLLRFDIPFTPPERLHSFLALSSDGKRLAYVQRDKDGVQRLYTRLLDQPEGLLVPGTDGARSPFFSPDGQWLGFMAEGLLKKILVEGGAAIRLCDAPDMRGASWGDDGNIVFTPDNRSPLFRVSSAGGTPEQITKLAGNERTHRYPQVMPGSRAVLFSTNDQTSTYDQSEIQLLTLPSGQVKKIYHGGFGARAMDGNLLWAHEGVLFGAVADLSRGELRGKPVPLLDHLASDGGSGMASFEISPAGILVGMSGTLEAQARRSLFLVDAQGKEQRIALDPNAYLDLKLSPDGRQLALTIGGQAFRGDVFVLDLATARLRQVTFMANARNPIWNPDGKRLYFGTSNDDSIFWMPSDGTSAPAVLLKAGGQMKDVRPASVSRDGRTLLLFSSQRQAPVWTLPLDWSDPMHPRAGEAAVVPGLTDVAQPALSPDGHWIAYAARDASLARRDIYVEPFPRNGAKWRISETGGTLPVWSGNGSEIFFESASENGIMSVSYRVEGNRFAAEKARLSVPYHPGSGLVGLIPNTWDVMPDGKRAVFVRPDDDGGARRMMFLLNFGSELQRRLAQSH